MTDSNGYCDFNDAWFAAGDYWFCETNMQPGWTAELSGYPGAIVPDNTDDQVDNSVICAPFTLGIGETVNFSLDNIPPPEGDARTIGFWKNWTSCDGNGNQDDVLDQNLPIAVAGIDIVTCPVAVDLLDKRDGGDPTLVRDGRKKAGDAAYGLAAQLTAYELNQNANAYYCDSASTAALAAHDLLASIGFNFSGDYLKGKGTKELANQASGLAGVLDDYNNNLCQ